MDCFWIKKKNINIFLSYFEININILDININFLSSIFRSSFETSNMPEENVADHN